MDNGMGRRLKRRFLCIVRRSKIPCRAPHFDVHTQVNLVGWREMI